MPMRLASLRLDGRPTLVSVGDEAIRVVGSGLGEVAELLAQDGGVDLHAAVCRAGLGPELPMDAEATWLAPVRPAEVWAAGVTYRRSRDARIAESREESVYDRVYDADRPELFFKASGPRVRGPGEPIGLRSDSSWQVPEPELVLVVAGGQIAGYSLGNDVSSRDIEGENPLYLPQAKIFAGSCAIGPVVVTPDDIEDIEALPIELVIERDGRTLVKDRTSTSELNTSLDRLVQFLTRDNWLPPGVALMTGTGIIPDNWFSLTDGDVVRISAPGIGTLTNTCRQASSLPHPVW